MKKGVMLALAGVLLWSTVGFGASVVNLSLLDNADGDSNVLIDITQPVVPTEFKIRVRWDSTADVDGVQWILRANGGAADGLFQVTAMTANSQVTYYDPNDDLDVPMPRLINCYTPYPKTLAAAWSGGSRMIYSVDLYPVGAQTNKTLAVITIKPVGDWVPGDYTIAMDPVSYSATYGTQNPLGGTALNVKVTPEPASALLLLLAAPFIRRRTA